MWNILLFLPAVIASVHAIDRHGCTGNILISQFVQGSVALYTYDPFLGNYSSYMNYSIANGDASRGVYNIASHGQFIYLQETGFNGQSSWQLQQIDRNTGAVKTLLTPTFACDGFAFDDNTFGPSAGACMAQPVSGNWNLVYFSFAAMSCKVIGVFPYTTMDGSDHSYDALNRVYYLRMRDSQSILRLVGMSVETGKVLSDVPLSLAAVYAGPLAIDPLTSTAYSLVTNNTQTQAAVWDLAVGTVSVYGTPFTGRWTQGGFSAVISDSDRCNLLWSTMLFIQSNVVNTVLVGTDLDSGDAIVNAIMPLNPQSNSIAYIN